MIELEHFNAGKYEFYGDYQCFVPSEINDLWTWHDPQIGKKLEMASFRLGELNSFARLVPNKELFIRMQGQKESVCSSRIEGTQTDLVESLKPEQAIGPNYLEDWRDVQNYIAALNESLEMLPTIPISTRLLQRAHKTLMQGVRGEKKQPGEYRSVQNRIGGRSVADASYIPPPPHHVGPLMSDLEKFLHNDEIQLPVLIRVAIAHYQFEAIHPFLDGNGRIGRLLIPLYLIDKGILDNPVLCISPYVEKTKLRYYEGLNDVRKQNDMLQWVSYFLDGVEQTAVASVRVLSEALELKKKTEEHIRQTFGRRSEKGLLLLGHLFTQPLISVQDAAQACQLSRKAASDLIVTMQKAGILEHIVDTAGRSRVYMFTRYTDIFASE
ncbi:MAG: Fic family protein [Gammaproteobacteria bacterium WSBS_2016_MAG_OTU1]